MMRLLILLISIFTININLVTKNVEGSRILCVFTVPFRSHTLAYTPLTEELARRGHDLVVITPDPVKNGGPEYENITQIDISNLYKMKTTNIMKMKKARESWDVSSMMTNLMTMLYNTSEYILQTSEVGKLINDKNEHFDAVIVEWYASGPIYAFSHRFNAPLIGISSGQPFTMGLDPLGNADHPVVNPDVMLPFYKDLTFAQRFISVGYAAAIRVLYYHFFLPSQDSLVKKYFGEDAPYIGDIENNIQLLILNFHAALGHTRPKVPGVIYTGSMHIRPKKPLPKDLQEYLDNSKEGVIYFSLGSNVKSSDMDKERQDVFIAAFKELPYKILWKWETEILSGKPDNVKLSKWLPQQDLLGHPNIKVFITQGGQQSLEEAIDNEIPLLGLPFMSDQFRNALQFVELGIGETLNFKTITKEELIYTLRKLIEDPKYKINQIKLKKLINDEPMASLERGCWWIEHVIRHKGARHLRSNNLEIPLYQYLFLDIIAFLFIATLVIGYINYKILSVLYRKCYRPNIKSDKKIN